MENLINKAVKYKEYLSQQQITILWYQLSELLNHLQEIKFDVNIRITDIHILKDGNYKVYIFYKRFYLDRFS